MKVSKRGALVGLVVLAGLLGGAVWRGIPPQISRAADLNFSIPGVPQDREAETYTGSFLDTTVSSMLERLNVSVNPEDKVYAFPDPSLGVGSALFVYRAQEVQLTDAGKTRTLRTWAKSVEELALEQNLDLAEQDKLSLERTAPIPVQKERVLLTITRVAESELTLTTSVPFATEYKDDATLNQGTSKTEQEGKAGTLKTKYLVRRENGVEVSRKVISKEQTSDPVTKIVRRGTKPVITQRCAYQSTVLEAAAKYGVDANALCYRMMKESNGRANAYNPAGPYLGLFQYHQGTWNKYSAAAGYGGADVWDPISQIFVTAWAWSHGHRGAWPNP